MDIYDVAFLFIRQDEAIESRLSTLDVSELHALMDALHIIQEGSTKLKKTIQERIDMFEPPFIPGTTIIGRGTLVFSGAAAYAFHAHYSVSPPSMIFSTTYEGAAETAFRYADTCNTQLIPYVNEYRVIKAFEVVLIEDNDDLKMLKHLAGGADVESLATFVESCFNGAVDGWMYKELDSGCEDLVVMTASHLSLNRTLYPTKEEITLSILTDMEE